ncbi:MAG: diaminopimelate epimerase [Candidatus Jidaibacter sp.]|nr:diaminopimelate epimerase [Candidatus Jidaibacter sp.]
MHSLGNDFVIIDSRYQTIPVDISGLEPLVADRNFGVGCDQLILLDSSDVADCKMKIFNANGSQASACGNATRCVVEYIGKPSVKIEVPDRVISAEKKGDGKIRVDMGHYSLKSQDIPLSNELTAPQVEIFDHIGFAINVGNPHFIIFTGDVDVFPLDDVGPRIENHYYFPKKVNVSVVEVVDNANIKIRTWERGCGETKACGTGACASAVVSHIFKGLGHDIAVKTTHGNLDIEVKESHVIMTGDANSVFYGFFDPMYFRAQMK